MLMEITAQPIFGITITLVTYLFGVWVNKKINSPLTNPLLIASVTGNNCTCTDNV